MFFEPGTIYEATNQKNTERMTRLLIMLMWPPLQLTLGYINQYQLTILL